MTAWREGSATGPKLNLSMSTQFFVRDAMGESVFLDTLPNVKIFCFFARKTTFPAKKADSVGQRESRSAPTYRVRKEAQSSTKQGSDPRNTRRTARCCVLLGEWGAWGHLRRRGTIQQMVPRVPFGPSGGYGVLLFTFLHSVHGVSQRGSVSVGSGVRGRLPLSCVVEPGTRPLPPASGGSCATSRARRRARRSVFWVRWRRPRRARRLSSGILHQGVESGCQPTVCRVMEDLIVGGLRSVQPLPGVDADCEQR